MRTDINSSGQADIAATRRSTACWIAGYIASGAFAIAFQPTTGAALWYPPIAVGMAFLVRLRLAWWPAIFVCDFFLSLVQYQSGPATAAVVAANTTIEVALGAYFVRRILADNRSLNHSRYLAVIALAGFFATGVGASLGSVLLTWLDSAPKTNALVAWQHWWLGDATSVLSLLPPFLLWHLRIDNLSTELRTDDTARPHIDFELVALLCTTVALGIVTGRPEMHLAPLAFNAWYLVSVLTLLWAAVRFPAWLCGVVIGLLQMITVLSMWHAPLVFPGGARSGDDALVQVQMFMIVMASAGVVLALAINGERDARRRLVGAYDKEQRLYQRLIEAPAFIYAAAAKPPYGATFISRYSQQLLGYTPQDLIDDPQLWRSRIHPDDRAGLSQWLKHLDAGRRPRYEFRFRHRDGHYIWLMDDSALLRDEWGSPLENVGVLTSINELHQAEVSVLAGECANEILLNRLNETQSLANIGSWSWDLVTDIVWWSDEMYRMLGATPETCEASLANTRHFIHPDDREAYENAVASVMTKRQPLFHELRIVTRDGRTTYCQVRAQTEVDQSGDITRLFGSVQDITTQRLAAADVEVARRLLAEAERLTLSGAARWHVDSDEWFFSEGWSRLQGSALGTMNSDELGAVVHPDDRSAVFAALQAVREGADYNVEHRIVRFDNGETRWVIARGALELDENGQRVLYTAVSDVTERRFLETRIQESQKLEAVGMLAGGIAHDFNNLLSVILGNVHLAQRTPGDTPAVSRWLAAIDDASARGKALVEQILAFSRQQPQRLAALPLTPVVNELWVMLRAAIPAGIAFERRIANEVPHILADATQMHQVIMNLCTNAWRAIERRGISDGRIEILLHGITLAAQDVERLPGALSPGAHVCLSVVDNGEGMDATTRERIFEPFFTTRSVGEGTGLGLAVVYGIVAKHGGAIAVDSTPGTGTSFHLYFPVSAMSAQDLDSEPKLEIVGSSNSLAGVRVLFIDDEPALVTLAQDLLNEHGCAVSGYCDSRAALEVFAAAPSAFDVLVSDHNMPGMSGLDVTRTIRSLAPQLPIIILSGRITDELTAEAERLGVNALLHKPDLVTALTPAIADSLAVTH